MLNSNKPFFINIDILEAMHNNKVLWYFFMEKVHGFLYFGKMVIKLAVKKSAIAWKKGAFSYLQLIVSLSHNLSPRTRIRGFKEHLDECHISNSMFRFCVKSAQKSFCENYTHVCQRNTTTCIKGTTLSTIFVSVDLSTWELEFRGI